MYESYFGLNHKPFELLPNPSFLYMSMAHRKAVNYLTYGIRQQSGFILLTGEVGTGKTTLIRSLIKSQLSDVTLAKIFNTKVCSQQLIEMILDDFGVQPSGKDKPTLLRELNDFLISQYAIGRQCVLIVDEAQNLTHELLEEVRMLSNLENDHQKLLRIILVGQPELKQLLASPSLLQLRQRIQVSCHISPLPAEELPEYILYRLESAGNREAVVFDKAAFDAVHSYTRGVPRLINILCDYLLLDAFANESREITEAAVHEVAADLNFDNQYWNPPADPADPVEDDADLALPKPAPGHSPAHVASHASGRATAKITALLKNLNNRLKTIEETLPRLESSRVEAARQAAAVDQGALHDQLAQFQDNLQGRFTEMWTVMEQLSGEVHGIKVRLEEDMPQAAQVPEETPEETEQAVEEPSPKSGGSWMKRLIFRVS